MIHIDNWDAIEERQPGEYSNPIPGAYTAVIIGVNDIMDKEYLEIQWDFADGEYQGFNMDTYTRAGFWPTLLRRSYKTKALGYFKAFKTAVEKSNPGYRFDDRNIQTLRDKRMGVILGEEEYQKKDGTVGQRLYVYQVHSLDTIHDGNFTVPELKRLKPQQSARQPSYTPPPAASGWNYGPGGEDGGELPF